MRKTLAIAVGLISMITLSVAILIDFPQLATVAVVWGAPALMILLFNDL